MAQFRASRAKDLDFDSVPLALITRTSDCRVDGLANAAVFLTPEKIRLLPTTARELYKDDDSDRYRISSWARTLRPLLTGTRSVDSPLSLLRNHEQTLLRHIYEYAAVEWAKHVKLTLPAALVGSTNDCLLRFPEGRDYPGYFSRQMFDEIETQELKKGGLVAFSKCGDLTFPTTSGRNVNMMPFILGDVDTLPEDLRCYYPLIEKCPYLTEELGKVAYLTVHESYVQAGQSQRRQGLHIESPGFFSDDPNAAAFSPAEEHPWGMGFFWGPDRYEGGIYFASTVDDTSEVWDALVDKNVPGLVDRHGGCEHLRGIIGGGIKLRAGELVWMTDSTPHEALLQETPGYRQFFRLVMPYISHWYADHSTENPKVNLPDTVTVIRGSKFANSGTDAPPRKRRK